MTPRTTLTRLGISAAATALSVCAVTPALASPTDDDWGTSWNQQQQSNQNPNQNGQNPNGQNQTPTPNPNQNGQSQTPNQNQNQNPSQTPNPNPSPSPSQNTNNGGGNQQSNTGNSWNQGNGWNQGTGSQQSGNQQSGSYDWGQHNNSHTSNVGPYQGIVTANGGLRLRSAPNRGGAVIRVVPQGSIVNIFCKTGGENVDGNSLWYLLTDGTWAWGAARYINNIGAAPRFC